MPRCSQANCRIAETGVCLEGHKQGCPYLITETPVATAATSDSESPPTSTPRTAQHRRFHTGDKFTVSEASRLLNDRPCRVVLCAGAQKSGKTTFLARLGEMFRDGAFSHYRFAGSLTLCAFERVSWSATVPSGASSPKTVRSLRVENDTFYHLRIHPSGEPAYKLDLLISDLAGETFPTAVSLRQFCADLRSLARADHLVLFLDSARLADQANRHTECDNARAFLQQVLEVKHESRSLEVEIVFSRWDYIVRNSQSAALVLFCQATEEDFKRRFGGRFAALEFRRVMARPDGDLKPTDDVIQSIFAHWLETPIYASTLPTPRARQPARDFSAFGLP